MERAKTRLLLAFAVPLVVYTFGFRYLGGGDATPAELLPISLLTEGDLDFDEFVEHELPYWFHVRNGRVVSAYPIVAGVLNVPVYAAAHLLGVDLYAGRFSLSMATASLMASLSVLFLYLGLKRIRGSEGQALFLAFVFAFATGMWSTCSRSLLQHSPSLLFLSAGFFFALRGKPWDTPLAGLALGFAVISRPTNIFIAIAVAVFVLRSRPRGFAGFAAFAAVPALLHALYAYHYWGSPWSVAQPRTTGDFSGNLALGLAGLLVSPSRGLLIFSPIFLFCLPAAVRLFRAPTTDAVRLVRYLTVSLLPVLLLFSKWGMWWGGHSFGYRIIVEVVPILILLLAADWPRIYESRPRRVAFAACLVFSIYVQFLGAMVGPGGFNDNIDLQTARLWDLRDSQIPLSTRRLLRELGFRVGPDSGVRRWLPAGGGPPAPPVPAWWTLALNDHDIPGWLDGPRDGDVIRGPLRIEGWAKSSEGEVDVRVSMSPAPREVKLERYPRPDVSRALPHLGDTSRTGFRATLEPIGGELPEYALLVEYRSPSGKVRLQGPIRFRWGR